MSLISSGKKPALKYRSDRSSEVLHLAKGHSVKALIVDGVVTNRDILSEVLRDLGIEVYVAEDGREPIDLVGKAQFDIIFMDILMPVMNGIEATKYIRMKISSDRLKIVAITALGLEEKLH